MRVAEPNCASCEQSLLWLPAPAFEWIHDRAKIGDEASFFCQRPKPNFCQACLDVTPFIIQAEPQFLYPMAALNALSKRRPGRPICVLCQLAETLMAILRFRPKNERDWDDDFLMMRIAIENDRQELERLHADIDYGTTLYRLGMAPLPEHTWKVDRA